MSNADVTNFNTLKQNFPVFEFKNKTGIAQIIRLADNDSVQVQANSVGKVSSAALIQVPDFRIFKPIRPDLDAYMAAGVIPMGERKSTASKAKASSSSNKPAGKTTDAGGDDFDSSSTKSNT